MNALFLVVLLSTGASPDRALSLPGVWHCTGTYNETGTATFESRPDGLVMTYRYRDAANLERTLDAEFHYDASSQRWTLRERGVLPQFLGTAPLWDAQVWTFSGAVYPPDPGDSMFDRTEPATITFVAFGNSAFDMIRTQEVGGQWVTHDPWSSAVMDDSCERSSGTT